MGLWRSRNYMFAIVQTVSVAKGSIRLWVVITLHRSQHPKYL
ncbi:hypothetical protein SAMN05216316_2542 [Nitrosovibrio sp. Nv6]|nr:hypothetical protein SAMN05216316_2542 [Nitrosovibrio sp. Nv6]